MDDYLSYINLEMKTVKWNRRKKEEQKEEEVEQGQIDLLSNIK